jgi:hypothetical protein
MGQVTIYLDDETERKMKAAANAAGLSYSKWVARVVRDCTRNEWPEQMAALAGAWRDDGGDESESERIEGADVPREPF